MKAGIVYKPKPLPLDGDSSSRRSGSSAKKDASAIEIVPRVSLAAPPYVYDKHLRFLIEIANPTTNVVDVRLDFSSRTREKKPIFLSPPVLAISSHSFASHVQGLPIQTQLEPMDEDDDVELANAWNDALKTFSSSFEQQCTSGLISSVKRLAWLQCDIQLPVEREKDCNVKTTPDFILLPLVLTVNNQSPLDILLAAPWPSSSSCPSTPEDKGYSLSCAYRAYL